MVCSRLTGAAPAVVFSRRPKASGTISSTAALSTSKASFQPRLLIKKPSVGTIKNCPKEPAAAATPMAQERFSAEILRPITP